MNRLTRLLLFLPVLLVPLALGLSAPHKDRVLIIQDELPQMQVLSDFLTKKGNLTVEITDQQSRPADLTCYHAVIVFIHGKLLESTETAVIDYTTNGGMLICLHHSISSKKALNKFYFKFLGIQLDKGSMQEGGYNWKAAHWTLVNLNSENPIINRNVGWPQTVQYTSSDSPSVEGPFPAITLDDDSEVFINHKYTDGRQKTVLCGLIYKDPTTGRTYMQDRAAWLKKRGKGTIFYFLPGHSVSDYQNPNITQIILNAINHTIPPENAEK